MIREVISELKKYTVGKKNTQKTEISVLALNRLIFALEEQEPKTGHWIEGKYKDTCDKCRCTYPKNIGFKKYCLNCGARMIEPQESEE